MLRRVWALIHCTCCSGYFFTKATVGDQKEQLEYLVVCHAYHSISWWYMLGRTDWSGPYLWGIYREPGCIEQLESCFYNGPDLNRWVSLPSGFLTTLFELKPSHKTMLGLSAHFRLYLNNVKFKENVVDAKQIVLYK